MTRAGRLCALVLALLVGGTGPSAHAEAKPAQAAAKPAHSGAKPGAHAVATCSASPFRSDPARHRWFRIPAVVRTDAGTLVAFAERRDRIDSDLGDFDIATARSTDGGCTWSAYRVIGDDAGNRVSNPAPLVDRTTGAILLFSVITPRDGGGGYGKGLYLQTSTDDGVTFTGLLANPIKPAGAYKGGLTGPGHGIQLAVSHPGRLIVPMGYRTAGGLYGGYGIYSDDHGSTWTTGYDEQDLDGAVRFIEGTIAEQASGDLFISYRDGRDGAAAGTVRRYAVSADGGQSLQAPFALLPLKVVSVEGSALALTGSYAGRLLYSSPGVTDPNLRRQMTIFVSMTGGQTWGARYPVELQDTPGAYSDLVQVNDDTVGLVYETGIQTAKERIAFESVKIATLNHPALAPASLAYYRSPHPTKSSTRARVRVTVRVSGAPSPPGRVTLSFAGNGTSRRTAVDLTYSNRGVRMLTLPRLRPGSYRLVLTYSGTGRIAKASRSAGTLRVVRG